MALNDWWCRTCSNTNFAWRTSCHLCGAGRPDSKPAQVERPGDWRCQSCAVNNFASRHACFKCGRARPAPALAPPPAQAPVPAQALAASAQSPYEDYYIDEDDGATAARAVASVADIAPRDALDDERLCVVCCAAPRTHLLLDCRHLHVCEQCVRGLERCPVCRAAIRDTMRVYT